MFISRRAHYLIVETLQQRIAELAEERNFYRSQFTRKRGVEFSARCAKQPSLFPSAVESSLVRPSADQFTPSGSTTPLDANWSVDDRELFQLWCRGGNVANGQDPLDAWQKKYGTQPPLMALTV